MRLFLEQLNRNNVTLLIFILYKEYNYFTNCDKYIKMQINSEAKKNWTGKEMKSVSKKIISIEFNKQF